MPSTAVLAVDGPMSEPRYPTGEDATHGPFSFGSSGFCVNYTRRESGAYLRKKLFPEFLKSEKARKSVQDDGFNIDRSWVQAQLQHYGIYFSPTLGPFKAKALLLTSVAHGLVSHLFLAIAARAPSLTSASVMSFRLKSFTSKLYSRNSTRAQ